MSKFAAPAVGEYTASVYGLLREQKYGDAIRLLSVELQIFPRSRAALSLLGYSYYAVQDFRSAAQIYEELCRQCPEVDSYGVYYAQCLFKAGLYPEANKACARVDSESLSERVLQLQAAIKYEEEDLPAARSLLAHCVPDAHSRLNGACITFKEGKYEEARAVFEGLLAAGGGYVPDLAYNVALCCYKQKQYAHALALLDDLIDRGVREHPELSIGSGSDGVEVRSVGNTVVLRETALVEAFNLKAAVHYACGNAGAAREALANMPPRSEGELDPITLHNSALMHVEGGSPGGGIASAFDKLNFLLANPPFPPEAFGNLLLLYVQHGYHDLAADVIADNSHLTFKYLSPELYDFLDASLLSVTSPAEAYRRLDGLTGRHVEALRRHTKALQDARLAHSPEGVKAALGVYDEELERYIPVLLSCARIYWERENYPQVERVLRQAAEFASEHEAWQLGVAHACFMQEGKYREAIRYYEPVVRRRMGGEGGGPGTLLDVTAIVLANLCVAYIMTSQNDAAENLMRAIESEEERAVLEEAERAGGKATPPHLFHLCIVNLVIGTLYCSRGNYEFGLSRVLRSLEPMDRKLGLDTWFYVKRALLALAEGLAKHTVSVRDGLLGEVMTFLAAADVAGRRMPAALPPPAGSGKGGEGGEEESGKRTISNEARLLRRLFLKLSD